MALLALLVALLVLLTAWAALTEPPPRWPPDPDRHRDLDLRAAAMRMPRASKAVVGRRYERGSARVGRVCQSRLAVAWSPADSFRRRRSDAMNVLQKARGAALCGCFPRRAVNDLVAGQGAMGQRFARS
jgi:hypothetical protein